MADLVNPPGVRFDKEILRTGRFRDPASGTVYDLDERDLEELADSTNRWVEQGYKVWFPWSSESRSNDPRSNIGFWTDFSVEEDRLVAVAEILDERALAQLGRTFSDVSPRISERVRSASGEWFDRVIESVAAAVTPPVLGLGGFVKLERGDRRGRLPPLLEAAVELGLVRRSRGRRNGVDLSRDGASSEGESGMSDGWTRQAMAKAVAIASWARRSTSKSDPGRGPFVFEIPERPVCVIPESVYADAKEKAERWHELGREIERRTAEEKTKTEALGRLAEREAREGVSLEKEMTKLQDEIDKARKARERAEVRRQPALEAAWRASIAADAKAVALVNEYEPKALAWEKAVEEVMEQLAAALQGLEFSVHLRGRHYDGARRKFNLPETTREFTLKLDAEREAAK